jgi:hypothetical protein
MSTLTTSLNSALPLSTPYKSTYREASKTLNTKLPALSLGALCAAAPSGGPFTSGASKSTDKEVSKTVNTTVSALSLLTMGALYEESADTLPSGASFLLEIHSRRGQSTTPSQKMTRKEREYLDAHPSSIEKCAHPSVHQTSMDLSPPTKSLPPPQKMTKKDRDSLLQEALDLMSED